MRKLILATLAVLGLGGAATGIMIAQAQPVPPPASVDAPGRPHWMGWMHHGPHGPGGAMMHRLRTFALVYPQPDRNLSAADVQKIAEAFLLWNGNHTWKVAEVAPSADGAIGFALTTQEGSVIARFSMDPHTGRVTRTA